MKVAFFHGLESDSISEKSKWLSSNYDAWCPSMDYRNPNTFKETYNKIVKDKPDLLVGSSMGGWFAYCLSTLTGIPTLLLNPAVQGRSMEPVVELGNKKAHHTVILGKDDKVIDSQLSKKWFAKMCKGTYTINEEPIGHRTPNPIMIKYIKSENLLESLFERKLPDFKYPWTIIAAHNGNSRVQFSGTDDDYIVKFNSLKPKFTLCFFESDKLKSAGNGKSSISEVSKTLSTIHSIIGEYLNLNPQVTVYFVGANSPGEDVEEGELSKRGRVYRDLIRDNIKPNYHWKISKDRVGILIALKDTPLYESINEEWATEAPGNISISILPESIVDTVKSNFMVSRPSPGTLTVEELSIVANHTKSRTDEDVIFCKSIDNSPVDEFYKWLSIRAVPIKRSEVQSIWEHKVLIKLTDDLKDHYRRPRPYWLSNEIQPIDGTERGSWSFPSGHSTGAYLIAYELSKKFPHLYDGLMGIANRISLARVKTGVHFPSDIEAGKDLAKLISENI